MAQFYECWKCAEKFGNPMDWLRCEMEHVRECFAEAARTKSFSRARFVDADRQLTRLVRQVGELTGRR